MDFKDTVVLDLEREMCLALPVIDLAHRSVGVRGAFITSARDGVHNPGSLHPKGYAVDLRTKDLTPSQISNVEVALRAMLKHKFGDKFDVVVEGDHIHVEYDSR